MKQKSSSVLDRLRHRFPPISLYRSDLEEIIRIAETRKLELRLTDDNYEFENLDDLREHRGNRVKKLTVTLSVPSPSYSSMGVEIDDDGVTLWASKDDLLLPVWHDVKERIANRLPWYARYMKPGMWAYVALAFLLVSPKREKLQAGYEWITQAFSGASLFSVLVALWALLYLHRNRGVYLQREHEVLSFWDRYGEKIVMLVLGTILGVVGKVVSDSLAGR